MNLIITGGASGLGMAITRAVAKTYPDSKIYFTYFSSSANKELLEKEFENVSGIKCDFHSQDDVESLATFIKDIKPDILINNALTGIAIKYFHALSRSEILDSFSSDVVPTLQITSAFISIARKRKSGKIITVLSANIAKVHPLGLSAYIANKDYLLSMHKSWASENKTFNITSNCVSPEFMTTPLNNEVDERIIETMIASHPLKKLLTVDDVAETILFLCAASSQLNSQNIIINAAQG